MKSILEQTGVEQNEENDLEEMIREHGVSLYKYLFSLVRHKELAEDLYQEVLISAYLALPSIQERSKIRSWLYKIAMNKCRDYWRKDKSAKTFWKEKVYQYTNETSQHELPEERLLHKCTTDEMTETISELPDIYRDPILLFYYDECSLLEISDRTKLPLSTVKTRIKRAKDKLRPIVKRII